jgi:hypothetical protein
MFPWLWYRLPFIFKKIGSCVLRKLSQFFQYMHKILRLLVQAAKKLKFLLDPLRIWFSIASEFCSCFLLHMSLINFLRCRSYDLLFRITGDFRNNPHSLKAGTRFQDFSGLESDYIEASRSFIFKFLHEKSVTTCENHAFSYKKYWLIF